MNLQKSELFKLNFKLLKLFYTGSGLWILYTFGRGFEVFFLPFMVSALAWIAIQFYGCLLAEKFVKQRNYVGSVLAVALNVLILPGLGFPIALLGLYAFLNPEFRTAHLPEELPEWLSSALLKLDRLCQRTFT